MSSPTHLAILGSPFDPPHLGHLWMAQQTLQYTSATQIWLTPTCQHPFSKNLSPSPHRLRLATLMASLHPAFHLCDWELKQNTPSYTVNTLEYLAKTHPTSTISLLIGSDNLRYFHKWHRYRDILDQFTVFVFPRPGYPFKLTHPHLTPVTHPQLITTNISSTIIKRLTACHQTITPYLPASITQYIYQQHLYGQT